MKAEKILTELDNLCEFVLHSTSVYDFNTRFNFLLSIAVDFFENEISKKNHLPFNSYIFIDTLNDKINSIITKINSSNIILNDEEMISEIFILILRENFPEYYKNYLYQVEFINN